MEAEGLDQPASRAHIASMNWREAAFRTARRAGYSANIGLRTAWYGAHMRRVKAMTGGWSVPGEPFVPDSGAPDMAVMRKAFFDLYRLDRTNIEAGLYRAPSLLKFSELPALWEKSKAFFDDAGEVDRRRKQRIADELPFQLPKGSNRYPDYYLQNFHYQSDGWFSDESAELYDTQVEALFTGTADTMRRIAMAEIARELKGKDQRSQSFADIACGNGRFLKYVMEHYPRLKASGVDLSPNYTDAARDRLKRWSHVTIYHDAAETLPFDTDSQDLLLSIYLFHELPSDVRRTVLSEMQRVLRPGGLMVLADSVQFGDYEGLDGALEYFPHGFHEPYYLDYLRWDMARATEQAGFVAEREELAFLTKVSTWRKPV